jgi:hypothetical protein
MTTILLMLAGAVLAIGVAVPALYYSRKSERMIAAALADPDGDAARIVNLLAAVEFEKDWDSKESRYLQSRGILPPLWMLEKAHELNMQKRVLAEIDANRGLPLNYCNKKIAEALTDPTGESANLVRLIAAVKFADDPDSPESRLFREHGFVPSDDQLACAKESAARLAAKRAK